MSRVGLFGQISEIQPHLFLSGAGVLRPDTLRSKQITCIVNATTEEPNGYIQGIDYMKVRVEDSPAAPLGMYFDSVADRIHANRERGDKTLVHCVAGVSRSASLCMVYLIKYGGMTLKQAYRHVKTIRPIVRPNVGFWQQMIDYEKRLRGQNTVQMVAIDSAKLIDPLLAMVPDVYVHDYRARQQHASGTNGTGAGHHTMAPGNSSSTLERNKANAKVTARSCSVGPGRRSSFFTQHSSVSPVPTSIHSQSAFTYNSPMSQSSYNSATSNGALSRGSRNSSHYASMRYGSNNYGSVWTFGQNSPGRRNSLAYGSGGSGMAMYTGGRHTSALTPVRSRAKENLFSNLYHSTHSLLYPAFGI